MFYIRCLVKEVKTIGSNHNKEAKSVQNGTCSDCIFWYQCRQGKVDCHVKQK
jgi:hypothetical protein